MLKFQSEGPIQVELVSNGMETWLPVAAIVISLISIGLTLWFRYSDRLILKVTTGTSMLLDQRQAFMEGEDRITVTVTNRSRAATTQVTTLALEFNGSKTFTDTDPWPYDSKLPALLGPGESATVSYPKRGLGASLLGGAEGRNATWVRGKAVCGHKTFVGKKERKSPAIMREYARKHQ